MKTPKKSDVAYKEGADKFERALNEFYGIGEPRETNVVESVVGFIYANDATYPIHDFNVVYIVGSEGQTIERVYGLYQKY